MLKAVSGGGGKGMRIVRSDADFEEALDGCKVDASSIISLSHSLTCLISMCYICNSVKPCHHLKTIAYYWNDTLNVLVTLVYNDENARH
jgi:pyruvate carboxylase